MSKKVFKLIRLSKNAKVYTGKDDGLWMQYGYHHGNQCNYVEVSLVEKNNETFKHFECYSQIAYILDDAEVILNVTIETLKKHNIFIDEIQLLTEADIAFEEVFLDEET